VILRFGPREGTWRPWWRQIDVTVHGEHEAHVTIPDQPHPAEITITAVHLK
jgi:hypothetical protein